MVNYLQSIGVKFGQHLNAYTSFDETVYFLPIPSDDKEKVEKGFQIIEDWAFNTTLTPEEIDKERERKQWVQTILATIPEMNQ